MYLHINSTYIQSAFFAASITFYQNQPKIQQKYLAHLLFSGTVYMFWITKCYRCRWMFLLNIHVVF